MRIEATYSPGFSEHLLQWTLEVSGGEAHLEADWFRNPTPLRSRFRFEEDAIRSALPSLQGMEEDYQAPCEDLDTRSLMVSDGETTVRRRVYGAEYLARERPEIRRFLAAWGLLEAAVLVHLPAKLRD